MAGLGLAWLRAAGLTRLRSTLRALVGADKQGSYAQVGKRGSLAAPPTGTLPMSRGERGGGVGGVGGGSSDDGSDLESGSVVVAGESPGGSVDGSSRSTLGTDDGYDDTFPLELDAGRSSVLDLEAINFDAFELSEEGEAAIRSMSADLDADLIGSEIWAAGAESADWELIALSSPSPVPASASAAPPPPRTTPAASFAPNFSAADFNSPAAGEPTPAAASQAAPAAVAPTPARLPDGTSPAFTIGGPTPADPPTPSLQTPGAGATGTTPQTAAAPPSAGSAPPTQPADDDWAAFPKS